MGNVTFSSPCSSNFLLLHLIAESRWTCFSRCASSQKPHPMKLLQNAKQDPRVKEVFRRFFRTLQPMIHVIKKQNTYDFESKHLEKNKTSGTYLPNRGSIVSIYLDQTTNITSLIL